MNYFDFAASLARAQARYDAMTPPDDSFPALESPVPCPDCIGHSGYASPQRVFRCLGCEGRGEVERDTVKGDGR